MTDDYRRLAETPFDVHFLQHDIDIARPPSAVWPVALGIGDWMDAHELVTLDGRAGEVGHFEQVHPRKLGPEVPPPRHHVYGVAHLIPEKLIVLQVMPENGGSYGESRPYVSFDSIHLVDLGNGSTRVILSMIDAQLGHEPVSAAERGAQIEAAHDQIEGNLRSLKQRTEESNPRE